MPDSPLRFRIIIATTVLAGAGDFATGLCLVFAPEWTLSLMRVPAVREPVFMEFIGCFVGAVGISYFWGLVAWYATESFQRLRVVWEVTIIFRVLAGTFILLHVIGGTLTSAWLSVPVADGFWVLVQTLLICGGVFRVEK